MEPDQHRPKRSEELKVRSSFHYGLRKADVHRTLCAPDKDDMEYVIKIKELKIKTFKLLKHFVSKMCVIK